MAKFNCYFCGKEHTKWVYLEEHMLHHSKEEPLKCRMQLCKLRFTTKFHRTRHEKKIHTKVTFDCSKCDAKYFDKWQLRDHLENHDSRRFHKCIQCSGDVKFYFGENLRKHVKDCHPGKITCPHCSKELKSEITLYNHIDAVHKKQKKHKCTFCDKKFHAHVGLRKHMEIHTGERSLKGCKEVGCTEMFKTEYALKKHKLKFHPSPNDVHSFLCPQCPRVYKLKSSLSTHVNLVHKWGKHNRPYPCKLCHKSYPEPRFLEEHMAAVHTDERAFKCDREGCDKEFPSKIRLFYHNQMHKDEDLGLKYKCKICGVEYKLRSGLGQHMRMRHGKKPKRCCYFCGVTRATAMNLLDHIAVHTKEKQRCPICRLVCRTNTGLFRHRKLKHEGQKTKSAKCYFCHKIISDVANLRRHVYIHTGEKPFSCLVCGKESTERSSLNDHVKTMHNIGKDHKMYIKTL